MYLANLGLRPEYVPGHQSITILTYRYVSSTQRAEACLRQKFQYNMTCLLLQFYWISVTARVMDAYHFVVDDNKMNSSTGMFWSQYS